MSKTRVFQFLSLVMAIWLIAGCSKDDSIIHPEPEAGPYENGFFILNEGWFGHEPGSVNFYKYGTDSLVRNAYAKENNNEAPSKEGSTLQNGMIYNGRLYLISKIGGDIVVADAKTLKKIGVIQMENSDFKSMAPVSINEALVSTNKGIFSINLETLEVDPTPVGGDDAAKDLLIAGGKLYACAHNGVDIYNVETEKLLKHYDGPTQGYVQTPDKMIYGGKEKLLIAIDPENIDDTTQIHLTTAINSNDFVYAKPSIVASSKENAVFYVGAGSSFNATEIYKFEKGKPATAQQPFITLPAGESFYETGLGYDWVNDQIITVSITGYSETDKNFLRFYDAKSGELQKTIEYDHIYFPAMIVFQSMNPALN